MSSSHDALEQSRRLFEQRESEQVDFEAKLRDSRRALARTEKLLTELKNMLARGGRS
jgi:hypothetical protein